MRQTNEFLNFGEYEKVKFTFKGLEKYIIMELNTKIALEDLKFSFSSILKIDFFARRLQFTIQQKNNKQVCEQLISQKSLFQHKIEKKYKTSNDPLNILVSFIEEGA
ncbi:hypothetical protein pb186bvf_019441 [Paramecium bursaria]